MGRPRRQESRRAHLIAATQRVLSRVGLGGVRVREVATDAEMSPAAVLYYYPDFAQLSHEALVQAMQELSRKRVAVAQSISDPVLRLVALVRHDVFDPLPGIQRAITEIPSQVPDHPELATVLRAWVDSSIDELTRAIIDGEAAGIFRPVLPPSALATDISGAMYAANAFRLCGIETAPNAQARLVAHLAGALQCDDINAGFAATVHAASGTPATGMTLA